MFYVPNQTVVINPEEKDLDSFGQYAPQVKRCSKRKLSEHICFNDTCKDGWENETILLKLTNHQLKLC